MGAYGGYNGGPVLHHLNRASNKVTKISGNNIAVSFHIFTIYGKTLEMVQQLIDCLMFFPCFFHIWLISGNHATVIFAWFPSIFSPYMRNI